MVGETKFGLFCFLHSSKSHRWILNGFFTFSHCFLAYHWASFCHFPSKPLFPRPKCFTIRWRFLILHHRFGLEHPYSFLADWSRFLTYLMVLAVPSLCWILVPLNCTTWSWRHDLVVYSAYCSCRCWLFGFQRLCSMAHNTCNFSSRLSDALLVCIYIHIEK